MFEPSFEIGEVVSNDDIVEEFLCGNMGGMRRSKTTNTLVLVTDHTKGLYDDEWHEDILYYTGMGKSGDQSLTFQQNRTLNESTTSDIGVHLFEVLVKSKYVYLGRVELCGKPYQATQNGEDGSPRKVWIFPLKTVQNTTVPQELLTTYYEVEQKKAKRLDESTLFERAKGRQRKTPSRRKTGTAVQYVRDPYVAEYSKRRAKGICQLCKKDAPFKTKMGEGYLESHHIDWLSNGGADSIENTVALCPNCHAKMHVLNLQKDVVTLKKQAKEE